MNNAFTSTVMEPPLDCLTAPPPRVRRLLAVNLNYLGDALFTTPALAALAARFPDAEIDVLAGERGAAILGGNPYIHKLLVRPPHGGSGRAVALMNTLRGGSYDAVVLFQSTLSNALLAWAARVPLRIGFAQEGCTPFLTHAVPGRQTGEHVVDAYARLALAGSGMGESANLPPLVDVPDTRKLLVALSPGEVAFAERFWQRSELIPPVVGLVIGATRPQKRWPEEYFTRLADKLWTIGGMSSVLLGGPEEREAASRIMAQADSPLVSAVGQTTEKELAALVARLAVVVSGDSGPLHIATAMQTPVVALFGSTDPADTGPWRGGSHFAGLQTGGSATSARATVLYDALACAPCRKNPTCDGRFDCLRVLTPERVFEAACELLHMPVRRTPLPVLSAAAPVTFPTPKPPRRPPLTRLRPQLPSPVRSVVVLTKHRFMGDTIVAVPLLRATRRAFPDARITLLTGRQATTVLQNCPYLDEIVTYDPHSPAQGASKPFLDRSIRDALQKNGSPDLCLVADRSFRSAAIAWGCGGRIRAGFATERRGFLLTHPVFYDGDAREIECYLNILRAVAPEKYNEPFYDPTPQLWLTDAERERGRQILCEQGATPGKDILVGMQPGASYTAKQWDTEKFARVADALGERGAKIILLGNGEAETHTAQRFRTISQINCIDLTDKTPLRETMGVLSHLALFIGNDTGVNHIAASLHIPTIGLFGPTPARKWGNIGPHSAVLAAGDNCLPHLEVAPVLEAALRLLPQTPVGVLR